MSKVFDIDDVNKMVLEIDHLLFFLGESFGSISEAAYDFRKKLPASDKKLIINTDRCIDELVTLQLILVEKVTNLEKMLEM